MRGNDKSALESQDIEKRVDEGFGSTINPANTTEGGMDENCVPWAEAETAKVVGQRGPGAERPFWERRMHGYNVS